MTLLRSPFSHSKIPAEGWDIPHLLQLCPVVLQETGATDPPGSSAEMLKAGSRTAFGTLSLSCPKNQHKPLGLLGNLQSPGSVSRQALFPACGIAGDALLCPRMYPMACYWIFCHIFSHSFSHQKLGVKDRKRPAEPPSDLFEFNFKNTLKEIILNCILLNKARQNPSQKEITLALDTHFLLKLLSLIQDVSEGTYPRESITGHS